MELLTVNHKSQAEIKYNTRFADILAKFKALKTLRFSEDEIRKSFTKDELVALLIWFDEQLTEKQEEVEQPNLFTEYEEL